MIPRIRRTATLTALLMAAVQSAHAQQPPDPVSSDSSGNTAVGKDALQSLTITGVCEEMNGSSCIVYQSSDNTAVGAGALGTNTIGTGNTAVGAGALAVSTYGGANTAVGSAAMVANTTGNLNTALGLYSLGQNTTGSALTASGAFALSSNTTGSNNTAMGESALFSNTTASDNSAIGYYALYSNSTGANNTAFGAAALQANTSGKGNAAQGVNALYNNTSGIRNLGIGSNALYTNSTGGYNTALGFDAGYNENTGSYNIAIGADAGYNVAGGSNNIEIGTPGTAGDNNTIQIGVQGTQTQTTIAGVFGTTVTGSAVYVTSSGQLGVLASAERYKTDITGIGSKTEKLQQLRPVSFHLKSDPQGAVQYGLIAEEVDKVYPELVIRDAKGAIQGVRYEELAPMLLGEMQHERTETREKLRAMSDENAEQAAEIRELKKLVVEMRAGLEKLNAQDEIVARR